MHVTGRVNADWPGRRKNPVPRHYLQRRVFDAPTTAFRDATPPGDEHIVSPTMLKGPLSQHEEQFLCMPPPGRRAPPTAATGCAVQANLTAWCIFFLPPPRTLPLY